MNTEDLIATYPSAFHLAQPEAWSGIQRHGLLSTSALLDLFEIDGEERYQLEHRKRPTTVLIEHAIHGQAWLRDNSPIVEKRLPNILEDITPEQYFALLNQHVFFWPTRPRLETLLSVDRYGGKPQLILEVSTAALVESHRESIALSPYNTGATLFNAPKRGSQTLQPIDSYPFEQWATKRRSRRKAVTEIAVRDAVPDLMEILKTASIYRPDHTTRRVYPQ